MDVDLHEKIMSYNRYLFYDSNFQKVLINDPINKKNILKKKSVKENKISNKKMSSQLSMNFIILIILRRFKF